ncbi:MAG: PIN domain-containing protein [Acidobacteriia bacterium]|nr:PIN domain-containing protein [Terriglobia bacterium]
MIAEAFIDTNVLICLYDNASPQKQEKALALLDELAQTRAGVLSAQVLDEFYCAVTQRIAPPMTAREASRRIERLLSCWRVVGVTPHMVREAARGAAEHHLDLWDAQIWATAKLSQVSIVFTQSFPSGHSLEGVKFLNPFDKDFVWRSF